MNRVFEYMVKKEELKQEKRIEQQKDQWYDDSVEKIKKAIYRKLDLDRNAQHRTAQDYIDAKDEDIIDIEAENKEIDSNDTTNESEE